MGMKVSTKQWKKSFNPTGGQAWTKKSVTISKACDKCQKKKKMKKRKSNELQPLPQCTKTNQRVHINL